MPDLPQATGATAPATPSPNTRAALIAACGVERRDPVRRSILLHPADFSLHEGDRAVISGPSGSGKSVFLRALALLDPVDAGRVLWRGEPVARARVPAYRRRVAYIAQRPAMLDGSVEDNLRYPFGLKVYRDLSFDRAAAMRLAAAASRGEDFLDKRASDLSGGEAQIAALIRVLQLAPDVLLLDEPTASLDPDSAREIEALIAAWSAGEPARARIWISHDPAQARRVGDRQLTMTAGTLTEAAP
jgi:putative ABC transport system ATP-binding protein